MDRAMTSLVSWTEARWYGGVIQGQRSKWIGGKAEESNDAAAALDEIAVWVNEGGGGGEVRR